MSLGTGHHRIETGHEQCWGKTFRTVTPLAESQPEAGTMRCWEVLDQRSDDRVDVRPHVEGDGQGIGAVARAGKDM